MKNSSTHPNEDLQAIRDIMERSTRFLSLSGLSGILAGIIALMGAAIAWLFILDSGHVHYDEFVRIPGGGTFSGIRLYLALDALLVLGLAVAGAVFFSQRKSRKAGQRLWTNSTRRLVLHLMIPLVAGGIFVLILVLHNSWGLVASAMLIFYGLALVNAGKFTFGEIHYLGLTEIGLGILAGVFPDYGLLLWAIGFGLMHIVYGSVMYYRHERKR